MAIVDPADSSLLQQLAQSGWLLDIEVSAKLFEGQGHGYKSI
jgi:hypothetical protein